jgi:small subunit ribosomal protein S1
MTQTQYSWEDQNLLTTDEFQEEDAKTFRDLISEGDTPSGGAQMVAPSDGILKGNIVEIGKDFVVIDVGLKSEGMVGISEFTDPDELVLNSEVEVFLESLEDDAGQVVLSRERARRLRQWDYIVENCEEGSIITGKVLRKVKGGLMVDIGMEAFLPGSQIDNKRIKSLDEYIDNIYEFKILKINIERKNVVISRREVLEAERANKRTELLDEIIEGDIRKGIVKNITDFGVFLDLDGIDGLLHITDMTWKRIRHPSEMVSLGQELEVMILGIDREKGRIALGLKQKDENPWEQIEAKFPIGTRVHGRIVNLVPYGAFIEIEPGIEGLIHVSEMSWVRNVTDPSEVVTKGDEVDAIVLAIQKDEGKISLGLKQAENNPWDGVETRFAVGDNVKAVVKSLTNYGAFVELEPGIEGLIHISDLSWIKKVSHPSELLNKGDEVDAVILSIDTDSRKITVGMKQMGQNPWESIAETMPVGKVVEGVVTKITAFGAFLELDDGLEALVHVTELSDQTFGKVEDVVTTGQRVKAKVLRVDSENKKIAVSIKDYIVGTTQVDHDKIELGDKGDSE